MKNNLFIACMAALLLSASCNDDKIVKGEGVTNIVTPGVGSFNIVQAELPLKMSITIQKGATPTIKFRGYSNLLAHIKTKVEKNILFITSDLEGKVVLDSKDVVADVTVPSLSEIYLSSNANAEIHGTISGSDFKADVSGNSVVSIDDINTDKFSYKVTGKGSLDVYKGTARLAMFSAEGDNTIRAFSLQAAEASVAMKGQGKCEITASQKLTTRIGGSCSLRYKGHPEVAKDPEGGTVHDAN